MAECVVCGRAFTAKSISSKYCPDCRSEVAKTRTRDAQRRIRAIKKEMKPETVCAVCGRIFDAKTCAKYCPECRDEANRKKKAEAEKRLREKRKAENPTPVMATGDTPEQIDMCLNCKKKVCTGTCVAVREAKK